ncbi:MAG: DNA-processing protein DprA [Bacteroidales bacterium]|nr:DNA-processing protein DprA [Candidatus Liminaster caballi]
MTDEELRYTIALMNTHGIGSMRARHLIKEFGSARAVFEADSSLLMNMPAIGQAIIEQRSDSRTLDKASQEVEFINSHHIQALAYGEDNYPKRLLECPDAPALLFYLGKTDLNSRHIVSIVGTRSCSQYGRDMVNRFVSELKEAFPDVVIVSGLALGIDVSSHKAALDAGVRTMAVVAHGLDRIYPAVHRPIAEQMISQGGGILTEYPSGTQPERGNFLARNRIVAGMADAVLVAESRDKGGSLVTASIALDYGRDVYAFPGRVGDTRSEGCNRLIRLNRAGLITCAQDFIEAMNWESASGSNRSIQHSIPFEEEKLSPTARLILDALRDKGDMQLSRLSDITGLDSTSLYAELLDLEMDDKIRITPGGLYQLR